VSNTRPLPSPFPSSLVVDPTKEALEEFRSKVVVALDRVLANKDAVPRNEAGELAFLLRYPIQIQALLPVPVVLYLIKTILCLWAVSSLP
jgi:hypothetical protein